MLFSPHWIRWNNFIISFLVTFKRVSPAQPGFADFRTVLEWITDPFWVHVWYLVLTGPQPQNLAQIWSDWCREETFSFCVSSSWPAVLIRHDEKAPGRSDCSVPDRPAGAAAHAVLRLFTGGSRWRKTHVNSREQRFFSVFLSILWNYIPEFPLLTHLRWRFPLDTVEE